jgi:hypothetical protein
MLTIDWVNGESDVFNGNDIYELIFGGNYPWMLSANGTIFTYEREGVIPGLLKSWYAERKLFKGYAKRFTNLDKEKIPASSYVSEVKQVNEVYMLNWERFDELNSDNSVNELYDLLSSYGMSVVNGKITANYDDIELASEYWGIQEQTRKIRLNSLYGASLNNGFRFHDKRIGQSTTLCGRQVVKHMTAEVNKTITGEYDYSGTAIVYGDTDSVLNTTIITSTLGNKTIEELFEQCKDFKTVGDKEYAFDKELQVLSYDKESDSAYMGNINYIYRHKVSKDLYEIEDELGNTITVTEDHSVMAERDGILIEVKPMDISENDILISIIKEGE